MVEHALNDNPNIFLENPAKDFTSKTGINNTLVSTNKSR